VAKKWDYLEPISLNKISEIVEIAGKTVCGETSGKKVKEKETWWWSSKVQEAVGAKRQAKKILDEEWSEERKAVYQDRKKEAKKAVAVARAEAFQKMYEDMETSSGYLTALRIAKQRNKQSQDIYQAKLIKDENGRILSKDSEIRERWKQYFEKLMNEENPRTPREWNRPVKEAQVEDISEGEVSRALGKMKNGKAVGPDNISSEAWKVLGQLRTLYLTSKLNEIMEREKIPAEWRKSTLIPVFKKKGDILQCNNYKGIKYEIV